MASTKVLQRIILYWIFILRTTRAQIEICEPLHKQFQPDEFLVNMKRMVLISHEKNWMDARAHCKSIGMQLLMTPTEKEVENLQTYLNNRIFGDRAESDHYWHLWLDGADHKRNGVWKWMRTGENLIYTTWRSGEPNQGIRNNCLELWGNDPMQTLWKASDCYHRKRFICEIFDFGLKK